jgi:hypothetical protein
MRNRGRRRKQLPDDLKGKRRYCNLEEEALGHTPWKTCFGRGFGLVARYTTLLIKIINMIHSYADHIRIL